jgi:hypothetical protein
MVRLKTTNLWKNGIITGEKELQSVWLSISNDGRILSFSECLTFITLTTKAASSDLAPACTAHVFYYKTDCMLQLPAWRFCNNSS